MPSGEGRHNPVIHVKDASIGCYLATPRCPGSVPGLTDLRPYLPYNQNSSSERELFLSSSTCCRCCYSPEGWVLHVVYVSIVFRQGLQPTAHNSFVRPGSPYGAEGRRLVYEVLYYTGDRASSTLPNRYTTHMSFAHACFAPPSALTIASSSKLLFLFVWTAEAARRTRGDRAEPCCPGPPLGSAPFEFAAARTDDSASRGQTNQMRVPCPMQVPDTSGPLASCWRATAKAVS